MSDASASASAAEGQAAETPAAAAADPPAEPESKTTETTETTETKPAKPAEPEPKPTPDWRDRRIAELTARLRKTQPAPAPAAPAPAPAAADGSAELDRLVSERAEALRSVDSFNQRCNEAAVAGRQTFEDFDGRVQNLVRLYDQASPVESAAYHQFLLAALETGSAPRLLHELGGNLNEASRIMGLSPVKMGIELARMADKLGEAGTSTSAAPKPAKAPAGAGSGATGTSIDPTDPERADRLGTAEWMKRREAQLAARR